MDNTKERLITLFDDSLDALEFFKRKTYEDTFQTLYEKNKDLLETLSVMCSGEDQEEFIEELASVIPEYAISKLNKGISKKEKERLGMDYNLNMAAYVIPLISYHPGGRKMENDRLAERMVAIWNEKKVTELTLQSSSYELISSGFQKKWCYITTAVCESGGKPDDCYELVTLRKYRDEYLLQTEDGRRLVDEYYNIAPGIVFAIDMRKDSEMIYKKLYYKYLLPCIEYIRSGRNEECKKLYINMVRHLQNEYFYS